MKLTVGKLKEMIKDLPDDATIGCINLPSESKLRVFSEHVNLIDNALFKFLYAGEHIKGFDPDDGVLSDELEFDYYL